LTLSSGRGKPPSGNTARRPVKMRLAAVLAANQSRSSRGLLTAPPFAVGVVTSSNTFSTHHVCAAT